MCYIDKDIFPSCDGDTNAMRESTSFCMTLMIAERFGTSVVKDAFIRMFRECKDDCKFLVEICVVTNHLCWFAHGRGNEELSKFYADAYHKCKDWAFRDDTTFTKEELAFFYDVID